MLTVKRLYSRCRYISNLQIVFFKFRNHWVINLLELSIC